MEIFTSKTHKIIVTGEHECNGKHLYDQYHLEDGRQIAVSMDNDLIINNYEDIKFVLKEEV
jgi:hypothetical protein